MFNTIDLVGSPRFVSLSLSFPVDILAEHDRLRLVREDVDVHWEPADVRGKPEIFGRQWLYDRF